MSSLWEKLVDGAEDLASAAKEKGEDFIKNIDLKTISVEKQVNDAEASNGKEPPLKSTSSVTPVNYNMVIGAGIFLIILIVLLKK